MWSPSSALSPAVRGTVLAGLVAALPLLSACQVQPLYSSAPMASGRTIAADLSSIAIKPVETRYGQEVRNHLIFLFNGGSGQPAAAAYQMTLMVTALHESAAVVQVADENEPSAGTVTLTGFYVIIDPTTGEQRAQGRRAIMSSYDVPRQEFAAVRARRDGENRAARELADLLRLAIAQDLSRAPPPASQALK
jgi:LPS-assembly lipoprotein